MMRVEGAMGHAASIAKIQQIAPHLRLAELIGRTTIVRGQPANCLDVAFLCRRHQPGGRHVCDHSLTQVSHRGHPLLEQTETSVPASNRYPRSLHPARLAPTTAKPFSPMREVCKVRPLCQRPLSV